MQHEWKRRPGKRAGKGPHRSVARSSRHPSCNRCTYPSTPPYTTQTGRVPSHSFAPARAALHTPVSRHAPTRPLCWATRAQISTRARTCWTAQAFAALQSAGGIVSVAYDIWKPSVAVPRDSCLEYCHWGVRTLSRIYYFCFKYCSSPHASSNGNYGSSARVLRLLSILCVGLSSGIDINKEPNLEQRYPLALLLALIREYPQDKRNTQSQSR